MRGALVIYAIILCLLSTSDGIKYISYYALSYAICSLLVQCYSVLTVKKEKKLTDEVIEVKVTDEVTEVKVKEDSKKKHKKNATKIKNDICAK